MTTKLTAEERLNRIEQQLGELVGLLNNPSANSQGSTDILSQIAASAKLDRDNNAAIAYNHSRKCEEVVAQMAVMNSLKQSNMQMFDTMMKQITEDPQ